MAPSCPSCGSLEIESDSVRADSVCTKCGTVVETGMIVADLQFEENSHGGASAVGTFVSSEAKGGGNHTFGGTFHTGVGRESREVTLKNARKKIVALAQQLRLRPDHIDMAFYFFKLALAKHLTRGRKSTYTIAACVYITCRTEGTSHMLIDLSDILQVHVYELGRTYLRLSQALCINIPAMDPCLYVMRFAHKLEFGDKTHEVSMTALRLVSRMKKDWIHFGRRPSGVCGAALLIAARLHDFSRTANDVIKVVKVHESTLRKRLNEFAETSASQLTLDEFMNIDLDEMTEEQDPPCFKAARKKDRERLEKLKFSELDREMAELEDKIEKELEYRRAKVRGPYSKFVKAGSKSRSNSSDDPPTNSNSSTSGSDTEKDEADEVDRFITEQTLGVIEECLGNTPKNTSQEELDSLLMPPPTTPLKPYSPHTSTLLSPGLGLKATVEEYLLPATSSKSKKDEEFNEDKSEDLDLTGIDEDEIDSYIMSSEEIKNKTALWMMVNKEYLEEEAEKLKKEKEEREEMIKNGIDPDRKKKTYKKRNSNLQSNCTALEAIEKIVQEKKISTKINYDVLKNLNMGSDSPTKRSSEEREIEDVKSPEIKLKEDVESDRAASPRKIVPVLGKRRNGNFQLPVIVKKPRTLPVKRPNLSAARGQMVTGVKKIDRNSNVNREALKSSQENYIVPDRIESLEKLSQDSGIGSQNSEIGSQLSENIRLGSQEVVVESGPVEPAAEEELSDFSDEDEPMMSAAELLAQQFGESGYGEEEEYY